jgi:hypothetical protein
MTLLHKHHGPRHHKCPKVGSVWRRSKPTETRHVLALTFRPDVIYVSGRYTRFAQRKTCKLADWLKWQETAKLLED